MCRARKEQSQKRPKKTAKLAAKNFDTSHHWAVHDDKKCRNRCKMAGCVYITHWFCTKCDIYLCLTSNRNCFYAFHNPTKKANKQRKPVHNPASKSVLQSPSASFDTQMKTVNGKKRKFSAVSGVDDNSSSQKFGGSKAKKIKYDTYVRNNTSREEEPLYRYATRSSKTTTELLIGLGNNKK